MLERPVEAAIRAAGQRVVDEELAGLVDREDCALFEHRPIP
jgi:hypothetical protein